MKSIRASIQQMEKMVNHIVQATGNGSVNSQLKLIQTAYMPLFQRLNGLNDFDKVNPFSKYPERKELKR